MKRSSVLKKFDTEIENLWDVVYKIKDILESTICVLFLVVLTGFQQNNFQISTNSCGISILPGNSYGNFHI